MRKRYGCGRWPSTSPLTPASRCMRCATPTSPSTLASGSLFCPKMSYFTRVSGVMVKCSEIIDCGRTEQKTARCYCLLVVKLVVKRSGLLCRSCKSCNPLNKRIPRLPILFCCKLLLIADTLSSIVFSWLSLIFLYVIFKIDLYFI